MAGLILARQGAVSLLCDELADCSDHVKNLMGVELDSMNIIICVRGGLATGTEDFQSWCRSETIGHHWSLLVSIQAFNPVFGVHFYRFEHIVTNSSGKVIAK
jgi:hypothetical protein